MCWRPWREEGTTSSQFVSVDTRAPPFSGVGWGEESLILELDFIQASNWRALLPGVEQMPPRAHVSLPSSSSSEAASCSASPPWCQAVCVCVCPGVNTGPHPQSLPCPPIYHPPRRRQGLSTAAGDVPKGPRPGPGEGLGGQARGWAGVGRQWPLSPLGLFALQWPPSGPGKSAVPTPSTRSENWNASFSLTCT